MVCTAVCVQLLILFHIYLVVFVFLIATISGELKIVILV